ncbi:MAG: hypothetical protein WBA97_20175, partial [Actinophytocola sp.]|uniref:hypothetical protein n=1 Tax=Actinophytocola sp. TaxID=1872138 RepID=UPI003C73AAE0
MTARRAGSPLTFGQLSVWRIMERHPFERWPESYLRMPVPVPAGAGLHEVVGALDMLCARHETLRTHFVDGDAGPRQLVAQAGGGAEPVVVDRDEAGEQAVTSVCEELARDRIERSAEFGRRFAVLRVAGRPTHVAIVVDHIVADGYGLKRLRAELTSLLGGADHRGDRWLAEDPPPRPRELAG